LVEEVEVGSALVGDIIVKGGFDFIFVPLNVTIPVVLLVIVIIFVVEGEVGFLGGILTFYIID
jgi:hypothetical protein